jgi:hypothetical protein
MSDSREVLFVMKAVSDPSYEETLRRQTQSAKTAQETQTQAVREASNARRKVFDEEAAAYSRSVKLQREAAIAERKTITRFEEEEYQRAVRRNREMTINEEREIKQRTAILKAAMKERENAQRMSEVAAERASVTMQKANDAALGSSRMLLRGVVAIGWGFSELGIVSEEVGGKMVKKLLTVHAIYNLLRGGISIMQGLTRMWRTYTAAVEAAAVAHTALAAAQAASMGTTTASVTQGLTGAAGVAGMNFGTKMVGLGGSALKGIGGLVGGGVSAGAGLLALGAGALTALPQYIGTEKSKKAYTEGLGGYLSYPYSGLETMLGGGYWGGTMSRSRLSTAAAERMEVQTQERFQAGAHQRRWAETQGQFGAKMYETGLRGDYEEFETSGHAFGMQETGQQRKFEDYLRKMTRGTERPGARDFMNAELFRESVHEETLGLGKERFQDRVLGARKESEKTGSEVNRLRGLSGATDASIAEADAKHTAALELQKKLEEEWEKATLRADESRIANTEKYLDLLQKEHDAHMKNAEAIEKAGHSVLQRFALMKPMEKLETMRDIQSAKTGKGTAEQIAHGMEFLPPELKKQAEKFLEGRVGAKERTALVDPFKQEEAASRGKAGGVDTALKRTETDLENYRKMAQSNADEMASHIGGIVRDILMHTKSAMVNEFKKIAREAAQDSLAHAGSGRAGAK